MKGIIGGAVVVADVIAGYATPKIMAGLHKPHAHLTGPVLLYAVLGLATIWVIMSVAGAMGAGKKPAPRTGYTYGGRG